MALCGNLRVSYRETRRGTRRFFCGSLTGWANSVGLLFKGVTVRRQKSLQSGFGKTARRLRAQFCEILLYRPTGNIPGDDIYGTTGY